MDDHNWCDLVNDSSSGMYLTSMLSVAMKAAFEKQKRFREVHAVVQISQSFYPFYLF
jgi:hypothetical protein